MFIRGRGNALLYDHLVHTAYSHAVFFFLLLVNLVLAQVTPIPDGIMLLVFAVYMMLYLPVNLKHMLSRGPIKTIWTSYAVGFIYLIVIICTLTWLSVTSFLAVIEQATLFRG